MIFYTNRKDTFPRYLKKKIHIKQIKFKILNKKVLKKKKKKKKGVYYETHEKFV